MCLTLVLAQFSCIQVTVAQLHLSLLQPYKNCAQPSGCYLQKIVCPTVLITIIFNTSFFFPLNLKLQSKFFNHVTSGYISTLRNNVRSRAWGGAANGCSYRIERCCIVKVVSDDLQNLPININNLVSNYSFCLSSERRWNY